MLGRGDVLALVRVVKFRSILERLEVLEPVVDNVGRLVAQDLAGEVVQHAGEILGDREFLKVLASH